MGERKVNAYLPDHVTPPGETLLETLETIGMSQAELARRMGRPKKTINEIVQGKATITGETAIQFEQVLGIPARFWLTYEAHYRESLARLSMEKRLTEWVDWLKEIPINQLMRWGWIPKVKMKTEQVYEALKFFGVAEPEAWRVITEADASTFRRSATVTNDPGATAAWLRKGEIEAITIDCAPFDANRFTEALTAIRTLTRRAMPDDFLPELGRLCAGAGVAVVFVRELPHTGICGATRWLTSQKAVLQLSLRYRSDDQLWFTFFHEAGHILKHGKQAIFLESGEDGGVQEAEANQFAADTLIPPADWRAFTQTSSSKSKQGITAFARAQGIAPGIVVGRLQHEHVIPHSHCNELKHRYTWAEEEVDVS